MILAGDVGGTNTRLAIFEISSKITEPKIEKKYESDEANSLIDLIHRFIQECEIEIDAIQAASFAVAGPVIKQRVQVTNLSWEDIDGEKISEALKGVPVALMNDLVGMSNFVPMLDENDVVVLNAGEPEFEGSLAVIAPGTGLGEAFLVWTEGEHQPFPSEGGHTDFGPIDQQQLELMSFLMPQFGHVSYERVCAGIGIPNLYAFLKSTGDYDEPEALAIKLEGVEDIAPIIFNAAMNEGIPICVETVSLFCRILGAESGNMALKTLASGGVYLGGGIPPRILPFLKEHFMPSFLSKGRFESVVKKYPVYVIVHSDPVLFGAAKKALSIAK